jgi:8-oxo-dGTP pyrophosphatase MutT (NUDIX family)
MNGMSVIPVERLELAFAPRAWPFAVERRSEIDRHFATLKARQPALWNGRVLLLRDHALEGTVFRGRYFETDFASFLAWRDWDFPDPAVKNCFAMGALRTADGAFLLAEMGAHTANAGMIYFPSGTPDPDDIAGDRVDLAGNLMRELAEETGLDARDVVAEQGWFMIPAGPRIAQIKLLHVDGSAERVRARIRAHIDAQAQPELSDMRIARGPDDFDPEMPPFVRCFLDHAFTGLKA